MPSETCKNIENYIQYGCLRTVSEPYSDHELCTILEYLNFWTYGYDVGDLVHPDRFPAHIGEVHGVIVCSENTEKINRFHCLPEAQLRQSNLR